MVRARRYRRRGRVRLVRVVREAQEWETEAGDVMLARPGDLILSAWDRSWSIRPASFAATYRALGGDEYERVGEVSARPAEPGERVETQEGPAVAIGGQWLVTDQDGHQWLVPDAVFAESYRPID